jgi:hypothetical protein
VGYNYQMRRIQIVTKFKKIIYKLFVEELQKVRNHDPGSQRWLIAKEIQFGGYAYGIKEKIKSRFDSRLEQDFEKNTGMTGGDRMFINGYAKYYERHLAKYLNKENLLIVEVGILKGTGLAIWSNLFPGARLIGLDLDTSNCKNNINDLITRGAFEYSKPELHNYDQFEENRNLLNSIFGGNKINIFIDDGEHSDRAILSTFRNISPHLASDFTYFIEDNRSVSSKIKEEFTKFEVINNGSMTIVKPFKET